MSMHFTQQGRVKPTDYVVSCKRCHRAVPSGCDQFPKDNITVECPLCGELRRYRPIEVFLGFLDQAIAAQRASAGRSRRGGW